MSFGFMGVLDKATGKCHCNIDASGSVLFDVDHDDVTNVECVCIAIRPTFAHVTCFCRPVSRWLGVRPRTALATGYHLSAKTWRHYCACNNVPKYRVPDDNESRLWPLRVTRQHCSARLRMFAMSKAEIMAIKHARLWRQKRLK